LTRPRRAAAVTIEEGGRSPGRRAPPTPFPAPDQGPPPASASAFSDPRLGIDWTPIVSGGQEQRTGPSALPSHSALSSSADRHSSVVSPYASPVLVVVAAVAILEGYRWLNVLPRLGWRPSAVVFAAVAVPLAIAVTRGGRGGREKRSGRGGLGGPGGPGGPGGQRWAVRAVTGAALLLVPVTVTAVILPRAPIAQLMGSTDLLFAFTALVAVLVNERSTHSGQRAVRTAARGQHRRDQRTNQPSRSDDGRRDRLT
jgi:membrane protein implicated in regulation of membrane protease activity